MPTSPFAAGRPGPAWTPSKPNPAGPSTKSRPRAASRSATMSKGNGRDLGDYEVGYGKPPKHRQFVPGESGFKGHRKKPPESRAEIVARVRDQVVTAGGRSMTTFELSVRSVMNQTLKGGKPKDLKVLFELLDKYGAMPEAERYAQTQAAADEAMRKISQIIDRQLEIDLEAREAIEQADAQE